MGSKKPTLQDELVRFRSRWMHELTAPAPGSTSQTPSQATLPAASQTEPFTDGTLETAWRRQQYHQHTSTTSTAISTDTEPQAPSTQRIPSTAHHFREKPQETAPVLVLPAPRKDYAISTARTAVSANTSGHIDNADSNSHHNSSNKLPSNHVQHDSSDDDDDDDDDVGFEDFDFSKRAKTSLSKKADIFSKAWQSPFALKRGKPMSASASASKAKEKTTPTSTSTSTSKESTSTLAGSSFRADPGALSPPEDAVAQRRYVPRPQNKYVKLLIDDINADIKEPLFDNLLPLEVAELVFRYLDLQTLGRCACVSRAWHELATSNRVWHAYALRHSLTHDRLKGQASWRDFVQRVVTDRREKRRRWMELQAGFTCLKDTSATVDVTAMSFSPRGIAAGYTDGKVRFFERHSLMRSRIIDPPAGHIGTVCSVAHTGDMLVCGSRSGALVAWDVGFQRTFQLYHSSQIARVAICQHSPHPRILAASGSILLSAEHSGSSDQYHSGHDGRAHTTQQQHHHHQGIIQGERTRLANDWAFSHQRFEAPAVIDDMCELSDGTSTAAVLTPSSVDIINTDAMRRVEHVFASPPAPDGALQPLCSSLHCVGSQLAFLQAEPGQWTAHLVDAPSGATLQTYIHTRMLNAVRLLPPTSTDGGSSNSSSSASNVVEVAMVGSPGALFYDTRARAVTQRISTPGYVVEDIRVDDWRVVVAGRYTGFSSTRQPPFSVALYDRRMGKQLWFVRQRVPVGFLEMDKDTIAFGSSRHGSTAAGAEFLEPNDRTTPNRHELVTTTCLNVLDFDAPLSSLADEECPFSSRYEALHGYNYNIALETPFDDVEPYRFG